MPDAGWVHRKTRGGNWKACSASGKRGWASKGAARAGSKGAGHALHVYQCDACRLWHVAKRNE
jgi:hypothetical protein